MRRLFRCLLRHWYAGRALPILMAKHEEWRTFARKDGVDLLEDDETYGSRGWLRDMAFAMADVMLDPPDVPLPKAPATCALDVDDSDGEV